MENNYKPWKNYDRKLQKYAPSVRESVAEDLELLNQLAKYEQKQKHNNGFSGYGVGELRQEIREELAGDRISSHDYHGLASSKIKLNRHGNIQSFPDPKHHSNKITTHLNNQEHINNLRIAKNRYNHRRDGE